MLEHTSHTLSETLNISNVTVSTSNSGAYNGTYGGGIGLIVEEDEVTDPAYVKFTGFTATATGCGTRYFGGLVGKGDEAFIEASGIDITASGFHGGAAVGCMARGVLKLSGSVDFSEALPAQTSVDAIRDGKIVGYRDDALIYYDGVASGLTLNDQKVDNIGTWGDILIIDGTKIAKSGVLTENMVKIEVELYDGIEGTGTRITGSDVNNHIIYTNAKIYYDIVPNP